MSIAAVGRLSAWELEQWRYFEEEFGPLTVQERLDATAAQISYAVHRASGGKEPLEKFMPQWESSRPLADDAELVAWLKAISN